MEHSFNVDIAQRYGIEEAILTHNLYFWISKNASGDKHWHEGRFWTYNTAKSWATLFPYMSERKIARVLSNLEEQGVIVKGNYNKNRFDRTCWYAFTDSGLELLASVNYDTSHLSKMSNGETENVEPIPDNKNTDNNTDNKEKKDNNSYYLKKKECSSDDLSYVDDYMADVWSEWLDYLQELNKPYRAQATAKQNYFILRCISNNNADIAEKIVKRSITRGYWSLFPIKEGDLDTLMPTVSDSDLVINGQVYK